MCSVSLLYAQTICVSLETVVEAFPMLPLDSVLRERLSDNAESRYTDAWAVSGSCSAILMDISHSTSSSITCFFLTLMGVSPKSS